MREVKFDLKDIPQEMFVLAASDYTELSEDALKLAEESLSDFLNVPVEEMVQIGSSAKVLEADEPFAHPLSEINGDMMNAYALGSMLVNGLRLKGDYGDPDKCENFLVNSILKIKPETDINFLIGRVKLHQVGAMYEVCTILSDMGKLVQNK